MISDLEWLSAVAGGLSGTRPHPGGQTAESGAVACCCVPNLRWCRWHWDQVPFDDQWMIKRGCDPTAERAREREAERVRLDLAWRAAQPSCRECGSPCAGPTADGTYCSSRCRNRAQRASEEGDHE